jgi:hypothetical protein
MTTIAETEAEFLKGPGCETGDTANLTITAQAFKERRLRKRGVR